MAIEFDHIPINLRTPGTYVEVRTPQTQGLVSLSHRLLLIGQRLPEGEAAAGDLVRVTSDQEAQRLFGRGSMLANMFAVAFQANGFTEMRGIGLDDDAAGVAATGAILLGGDPTAAGTLSLLVGGERIRVAVAEVDTPAAVAAAVVAAINANGLLSVTAAVNGETPEQVDLTARHQGELGNQIDLRHSYYLNEALPKGLTCAITAMSGGSGNPEVAGAIEAMADIRFDHVVMPYTDAANLTAMETELADRYGPLRSIPGHLYTAARGTSAELGTLGNTRNSPFSTILGRGHSPTNSEIWAANLGAVAAYYLNINPARPLQTLELRHVLPPAEQDRFTQAERNVLLWDGISTYTVDDGGTCRLERVITTYQTNQYSVEDAAYLDLNTTATLNYLRDQIIARLTGRFPRHKLVDDGANVGVNTATVRPRDIKAEVVDVCELMERQAILERVDDWRDQITAQRNDSDVSRVDVYLPPDLVNQLRVTAVAVQPWL